ncbi:ISL3 family transposase, partial [Haloferula chungangensis]
LLGMSVEALFKQALGLADPWVVTECDFNPEAKSLVIRIDFKRGSRFVDESTGETCPVHDTRVRKWEHLKFFEHRTLLEARVPRIVGSDGKVKTVAVPWAEPGSGFTLLMEAFLLGLAKVLPVAEVARQTGASEDRIWHLIRTRVDEAWLDADWSSLERLGVDETSTRKGHKYGTAFLEIDGKESTPARGGSKVARLLFFTPGKGKETFDAFARELDRRGVPREQVGEIAMDMSPAFIAGAGAEFPLGQICFDRFHVMKLCGEACDQVRKEVAREHGKLPKGAMWALRGNAERLKDDQRELRESLCEEHAQLGRAHAIRDFLSDAWHYDSRDAAEVHLKEVLSWCQRSRLEPMVKLGRTLRRHWDGILGYYQNYTTSAAIEAINGLLQLAKRRARGYRRFENFRAIAYWIAGNLTLKNQCPLTH